MIELVKICGGCALSLPLSMYHNSTRDGPRNKCKACRRIEAIRDRDIYGEKRRRNDNERYVKGTKKNPIRNLNSNKYRAQYKAKNAITLGKIKRLPCETCGDEKSHAHHDDYLKIYDLRFLCARHHRLWHLKNGPGKNE